MRPSQLSLSVILSISLLAACSDKLAAPDTTVISFDYAAFGEGGVQLLSGSLLMSAADSDSVFGYWNIEWVDGADHSTEVGPQTGHGQLIGTLEGNRLQVDLNPDWADANVLLSGTWEKKKISGTWTYVSFIGPTTSGRFTLTAR